MDFQRFGIDPRLAQAASDLPTGFFYYEKMLTHAVAGEENVCVKISIDNGREEVLLLPALQWILSGEGRKVLVAAADEAGVERFAAATLRLGSGSALGACRLVPAAPSSEEGSSDEEGAAGPRLDGDPLAQVLVGSVDTLLAAHGLDLRAYGFLVADGLERLAEFPPEDIRRFCSSLLPSWERRSVLACAKFTIKAKNLAWDLADNPSEVSIEGEAAKAQSVAKETWRLPTESKLRFLLGLVARERPERLCVFCNLRDTAADVARRLAANGVSTDSILGPLSEERKFALIEKFRAGDCTCLALSDEGAEGLTPGVFPLVVNYDIPLEPELFVKRLEMLDRSAPGAKIVSLACDRYIVGLPAVEQYIDAKLEALPAGEEMLTAVDRSGPASGDRKPRGESPRSDGNKGERRRDGQRRRDGRPRDDGRRDEGRRDGRNPDIRKSIAEATGGSLDMGGSSGVQGRPDKSPEQPAQRRQDGRRRQGLGQKGGGEPRGEPRREPRTEDSGRGQRRPQGKGPDQRGGRPRQGTHGQAGPKAKNPYDMPMEERMRLYREKYGHSLDEQGQGGSGRGPSQAEPRPQQGQPAPRQGRGAQGRSPRPSPKTPAQKQPGGDASEPAPPSSIQNESLDQAQRNEGMVSKLFGAFKKKKD
jgi:ATP-dependent RNA helicase RhlB